MKHQRIICRRGEVARTRIKEEIISELDDLPPWTYGDVLDLIRFIKLRRRKAAPTPRLRANPCSGKTGCSGPRRMRRGKICEGRCYRCSVSFLRSLNVKQRPVLIIAAPGGDDVVLCQITSQQIRDRYAISIADTDFVEGTLRKPSNIRPNRLFSANINLTLYRAGHLNDPVVTSVIDQIIEILQAE